MSWYNLLSSRPRVYVFDSLRQNGEATPRLRTLCPTRWTVWHALINNILLNYEILLSTLKVQSGHDEYVAKARLVVYMHKWSYLIHILV